MRRLPPQFVTHIDKVPVSPITLRPINPHSPDNWLSYDAAVATGRSIGFVLTTNDPYFLVDMDDCALPDGSGWKPEALEVLGRFPGAAVEVSSSGRGLHIFGRCGPDVLTDRRNRWDGWLECYYSSRLVAFGQGWQGDPDIDHSAALAAWVPVRPAPTVLASAGAPTGIADEVVLERLLSARSVAASFGQKASPADLWFARSDVLARCYPASDGGYDASRADAALLSHLAYWCGRDPAQMERLFRQSSLMRSKFDRDDYRAASLAGAIERCAAAYQWSLPTAGSAAPVGNTSELLLIADQIAHFDGCVYVSDRHSVLTREGDMLRPEQFNASSYGGYKFSMTRDNSATTKKAFEAFTENRGHKFPKANRTVFRPDLPTGHIEGDAVNTYRPRGGEAIPGDCGPFHRHMALLIPDANDRHILTQYMAACVQRPGRLIRWAPVLQGTPGNGKTFFAQCIAYAIGDVHSHTARPQHLASEFNGFVYERLFVNVEEIDVHDKLELLEVLKPLITDIRIEIRMMRTTAFTAINTVNWFFATNKLGGLVKHRNDRRYAIFHTAQQSKEDLPPEAYFTELYDWFNHRRGAAAIYAYLLTVDISRLPNTAPITTSTAAAIAASFGAAEQHVLEAVEQDLPGFRGGWISTWAASELLSTKGLRTAPRRLGQIIDNLGYKFIMRSGSLIPAEGNQKPQLYALTDRPASIENYLIAQRYIGPVCGVNEINALQDFVSIVS